VTAALVAGTLVLAACGSDDSGTGTEAGVTEAPAAETAPGAAPEVTEAADGAAPTDTGSATEATTAPSSAATTPGTEAAPVEVPEALQFSASLVGGGELDLATLAGRPVLLWFWAPF
jgi:hypothetical protein